MDASNIQACYYEWLTSRVFRFTNDINEYSKLLYTLHQIEYKCCLEKDLNRYEDGLELKKTFCWGVGISSSYANYLGDQCSVLEMMVALAVRCETTIMSDPSYGDRTWFWFMSMLESMGLDSQKDISFDEDYVVNCVSTMLNRTYDEYGNGALFKVNYPVYDMRKAEVWTQMNWYLAEHY